MAGILRTDTIQNSNTSTIITQTNSTTITIGTSGQTIALASGATSSGFGRSGAVNWDTTAKTTGFTAVSGNGYFCNTTSAAFTITLPATPSAGDIVGIRDYAQTFATNNLTVGRNSSKIDSQTFDLVLNTNGIAITLIYVDSTQGWKSINSNEVTNGALYVSATGGTVLTCGDYKTHVFTGPGSFVVSCAGNSAGSTTVDYLVVAGGGGVASPDNASAGGGAGGFRLSNSYSLPAPTTSPLATPSGITVSATSYPITVGAGGSGTDGSPSVFSTITSTAGGKGKNSPSGAGNPGGSGGGGRGGAGPGVSNPWAGGTGNTPPVSPSQGSNGGAGYDGQITNTNAGGGGGAGAVGGNAAAGTGGPGGVGSYIDNSFIGPTAPSYGTPGPVSSTRYFSGGGGGSADMPSAAVYPGGSGGGGNGGNGGNNGTVNTGGGAGGGATGGDKSGGSGIVVIRYKYQ